jgi:hypothetical protein
MLRVLFWLLPVIDVFALPKILKYYESLGAPVPLSHAKAGLLERWVGYLPIGFIMGWLVELWMALLIVFAVFAVLGPVELHLMLRGTRPWRFFREKNRREVTKIFLLEGYNAIGYYSLGALLGSVLF